jgi:predicted nucleotidyltransferase
MVAKSPIAADALQNPPPVQPPENLPTDVKEWLSRISMALVRSFADDLRSLILFGSAAEGRMRASSDVNLLAVLTRLDVDRLDGVAELIQAASAAVELHPMFILRSEFPLAAEALRSNSMISRTGTYCCTAWILSSTWSFRAHSCSGAFST